MTSKTYSLYNPNVAAFADQVVSEDELKRNLSSFYQVYNPKKLKDPAEMEGYLSFAERNGVLALNSRLKNKYGCKLDEADSSKVGWARLRRQLEKFYAYYKPTHTQRQIDGILKFMRKKGLLEVDAELQKTYGESLTQFISRGLRGWQEQWNEILEYNHKNAMNYQLERFYSYLEFTEANNPEIMNELKERGEVEKLAVWAASHPRESTNEKLLEKYKYCLDDIPLVKGITREEREANLKLQLIDFYEHYDPARLDFINNTQAETELNEEAREGIVKYEELNEDLMSRYGQKLTDKVVEKLRQRLISFYKERNVHKDAKNIDKIVQYALESGYGEMNKALIVRWGGSGIRIDDL
eukprot:snap_masked-scaffold_5-processed-gene-9.13-mRNA-1 protein AED:1.00 eAED:1.00 QI:0/-1/0/0/-1/1/1/0/353